MLYVKRHKITVVSFVKFQNPQFSLISKLGQVWKIPTGASKTSWRWKEPDWGSIWAQLKLQLHQSLAWHKRKGGDPMPRNNTIKWQINITKIVPIPSPTWHTCTTYYRSTCGCAWSVEGIELLIMLGNLTNHVIERFKWHLIDLTAVCSDT